MRRFYLSLMFLLPALPSCAVLIVSGCFIAVPIVNLVVMTFDDYLNHSSLTLKEFQRLANFFAHQPVLRLNSMNYLSEQYFLTDVPKNKIVFKEQIDKNFEKNFIFIF